MATMHVVLPDALTDWVEAQAESGRFGSAGDYVRDLIRRDRERAGSLDALRQFVDDGDASGISPRTVIEGIDEAHARARRRGLPE